MSAEFRVDNQVLPAPSSVTVTPIILAESARALDGKLHVDYRATRRMVSIMWVVLNPTEMQVVQGAFTPYRVLQLQWTEPSGIITMAAVPRNMTRRLEVGRSRWDSAAQRWWWADIQLELEEV